MQGQALREVHGGGPFVGQQARRQADLPAELDRNRAEHEAGQQTRTRNTKSRSHHQASSREDQHEGRLRAAEERGADTNRLGEQPRRQLQPEPEDQQPAESELRRVPPAEERQQEEEEQDTIGQRVEEQGGEAGEERRTAAGRLQEEEKQAEHHAFEGGERRLRSPGAGYSSRGGG